MGPLLFFPQESRWARLRCRRDLRWVRAFSDDMKRIPMLFIYNSTQKSCTSSNEPLVTDSKKARRWYSLAVSVGQLYEGRPKPRPYFCHFIDSLSRLKVAIESLLWFRWSHRGGSYLRCRKHLPSLSNKVRVTFFPQG